MTGEVRPRRADAQRNRERILEAAEAVLAREGLSASVRRGRRAGRGGARHDLPALPTQEALYQAVIIDRTRRLLAEADLLSPDPGTAFFTFLDRIVVDAAQKKTAADLLAGAGVDPKAGWPTSAATCGRRSGGCSTAPRRRARSARSPDARTAGPAARGVPGGRTRPVERRTAPSNARRPVRRPAPRGCTTPLVLGNAGTWRDGARRERHRDLQAATRDWARPDVARAPSRSTRPSTAPAPRPALVVVCRRRKARRGRRSVRPAPRDRCRGPSARPLRASPRSRRRGGCSARRCRRGW